MRAVSATTATARAPTGVRPGTERLFALTEAAGRRVAQVARKEGGGRYLRVAVKGGGCSGLSYRLEFANEPRDGDYLIPTAGVEVVVDFKSAFYVRGTVLDYEDRMIGGGFKFQNPNAKASCSCGESFTPRPEAAAAARPGAGATGA